VLKKTPRNNQPARRTSGFFGSARKHLPLFNEILPVQAGETAGAKTATAFALQQRA